MKLNTGDYIFTPYRGTDYITPDKPYKVLEVYAESKPLTPVRILDDEGDFIYTLFTTNEQKSAHLESKGYWYKLECSIQRRHNT